MSNKEWFEIFNIYGKIERKSLHYELQNYSTILILKIEKNKCTGNYTWTVHYVAHISKFFILRSIFAFVVFKLIELSKQFFLW